LTDAAKPLPKAHGQYCPRCQSRKVVEGQLGEASRFYPSRPVFKALTGKPVMLSETRAYACIRCGLTWSELNAAELQKNIQKYGLHEHGTGVMEVVAGGMTGPLKRVEPPTKP
jgi:DNA-directed RNA polymerase subunit RPC12/RpoP